MRAIFLSSVLLLAGCTLGNLRVYSVRVPETLVRLREARIYGRDCSLLPWYTRNIATAVRAALADVPGATGLAEARVSASPFCIHVEGFPVREPDVVESRQPFQFGTGGMAEGYQHGRGQSVLESYTANGSN